MPRTPAAERYTRIQELFDAVVDLPPDERAALLEKQCRDDAALRQEVEALLAADAQTTSFGEQPAFVIPEDLFPQESEERLAGRRFGVYQVIREIGRGGLGAVYLAARADDEYRKEVAIKLIRRGLDTDDILRRFRTERQILAQLDHPNIARLIDGGTTDDGLPYFVMEYVKGEPITASCELHSLKLTDRLKLFRKVCAAVTYAHQNLVVHRDLKPSNILVTAEGEPKLLDFGIAKLLSAEGELLTQTLPALRVMTPDYASPEQMHDEKLTTASDVYSLGVILYELLSGEKPYRLTSHRPGEAARVIAEEEPPRPSSKRKSLRGDLDRIVLMAMRKEPGRRYSSAAELSEDIRRYLEGHPITARPDAFFYRTRKFISRNKLGAAAAAALLLSLIGGIFATTWQARRATAQARVAAEQRDLAQREKINAERVSAFLQNVLLLADPSWVRGSGARGRELTAERLLEIAATRAHEELADQPATLAGVLRSVGSSYRALGEYQRAEAALRESRDLFARASGEATWDTTNATYNLAQTLLQEGRFAEAAPLFREVLAFAREHTNRADDDQVLLLCGILNDYSVLLRSQGQPAAAEELLREALQFAPRWRGARRAIVGIHMTGLGLARQQQDDLAEAEKLEREAVAELRRLPGGERVELGQTLIFLGQVLTARGKFEEAERSITDGLAICERVLGSTHPSIALGQTRLAQLHYARGDLNEAIRVAQSAIDIFEAKLPPQHIGRADALITLGRALTQTGRAQEAEPLLRRALTLRQAVLPPGHRDIELAQTALEEALAAPEPEPPPRLDSK